MKIETLDEKCSTSRWQQQANTDVSNFEISLRIAGVPVDIVQQNEN